MTTPVEILVHISARSRASDDAKYRRQAQAYLDFEAAGRHDVAVSRPEKACSSAAKWTYRQEQSLDDDERTKHGRLEQEREYRFAETVPRRTAHLTPAPSRHHPMHGAGILTSTGVQVGRTPVIPRPKTAPSPSSKAIPATVHRRSFSESWETPPSVIPDSQPSFTSITSNTSNTSRKRSRPPVSSSQETTQSASPIAKRARILVPSTVVEEAIDRTAEDTDFTIRHVPYPTLPSLPSSNATSSPTSSPTPPLITRIQPAPPPTSLASFKTHLTESLNLIATRLPLDRHFQPKSTLRPLRMHERGYWAIGIQRDQWTTAMWEKFWGFLEQFVGDGRAGWGVWVERERGGGGRGDDVERGDEEVRVWCWGEVVGQVWLVLFLATDRKVKGMGARWVDGGGEVVCQM